MKAAAATDEPRCCLCGQSEDDDLTRWLEHEDEDGNIYCSDCWSP